LQKFGDKLDIFDRISVSFHTGIENLAKSLKFLYEKDVDIAINFTVTKDTIPFLEDVVKIAKTYDATLLLLTLKPVNKEDYEKMILPEEVYEIAKNIFLYKYIKIAVDGFTCNKCYGAKRFLTIDAIGNVYPCSFLRKPLGNILEDKPIKYYMKKGLKVINTYGCPYRRV
jgi:MoaA/NifB/PqqE/SkfB family radical SAM enzyme